MWGRIPPAARTRRPSRILAVLEVLEILEVLEVLEVLEILLGLAGIGPRSSVPPSRMNGAGFFPARRETCLDPRLLRFGHEGLQRPHRRVNGARCVGICLHKTQACQP
jgi:hypothetical protein